MLFSDSVIKFNFAILVAGFKSKSTPHEKLYTDPISMPTLHVYGETDKVIPKGKATLNDKSSNKSLYIS